MLTRVAPRIEQPTRISEPQSAQTQALMKRDALEAELAKVSYFSPVTRIDVETHTAVLHYRDAETGKTVKQYPSEKQVQAYQRAAALDEARPEQATESGESSGPDHAQNDPLGPEQGQRTRLMA